MRISESLVYYLDEELLLMMKLTYDDDIINE